jgi:CRP-like cAMP-binding protein
VHREGQVVAELGAGGTMGEMAYLAPNPELRTHTVDITVSRPTTTVSFTPEALDHLSLPTRHQLDKALIGVLVRRLRAAHETMAHPRLV